MHSRGLAMACGDTEPTALGPAAVIGTMIILTRRRGSLTGPGVGGGEGFGGSPDCTGRLAGVYPCPSSVPVQTTFNRVSFGASDRMPGSRTRGGWVRKRYKGRPAFFLAEARVWEEGTHAAIFTFLQKPQPSENRLFLKLSTCNLFLPQK